MSDDGAWNCGKCGGWIFSFNLCVHDCKPVVPTLDWDWDDDPRKGPLPEGRRRRLRAEGVGPGPEGMRPMKRSGFKPKYPRKEPKQLDACYTIKPKAVACRIEGLADRMSVPVPKVVPVEHEGYRRLVAALPCIACGVHGWSQCAHPNTNKAMAGKTDDRLTFPLCCDRIGARGCHSQFDQGVMLRKSVRREIEPIWGQRTRAKIRAAGAWPTDLPAWNEEE